MKKLIIIPIAIFLICCNQNSDLRKAENEINKNLENHLICNNRQFYNDLEKYFENYLTQNKLIKNGDKIEDGYYNYLNFIIENGRGINKIENNITTKELKEKLQCAGYNLTPEKNNFFLFDCFEPTISKFKSELINEGDENELIYRIGTSNPSDEMNLIVIANGLLRQYKMDDFKRPVLKKFIILFFFVQLEL